MHLRELFQYLDEEAAEMSRLVVEMIRVNSVNPPGNEAVVAEILAAKMHDYGLEVSVIPLEENRANVVAILRGKGTGPALLYSGHLDTVPPGEVEWKHDPFSGAILGERIYGRGAADMKGGLAAMVIAAGALARAGVRLEGDLIIAATAGEETDSMGAKHFVGSGGLSEVGAIVIAEPSGNNLYIAEKGALWLEVSTFGKTAHGSTPDLGINAILHMNAFLTELVKFRFEYHEHDLLGGPTTNIGTIKGGIKTNVVPDRCTVTIDMRSVPGMHHGPIVEEINNVCGRLGSSIKDFKAKVEVVNDRPPVETAPNEEIVKLALQTARDVLGRELTPAGANYYTDAAVFVPAANLPMIIFGPGDARLAHQPDEYIEIPKLTEAVKFFVALALAYLRNPRNGGSGLGF